MRKLFFGMALTLPLAFTPEASALPGVSPDPLMQDARIIGELIEVKGGRGGGHGWGRGHGGRAWGWSRGRKVGWRGRGCPPGLWRQGRC
jgi:hypothetical protein